VLGSSSVGARTGAAYPAEIREDLTMKILCWFLGHIWSSHAGFYDERPHQSAHCVRCGTRA